MSGTEICAQTGPDDEDEAKYIQQYDQKGHPKNPEVTRVIEAQIAAKNEVLAAVGVCERKNIEARQGKLTFTEEEWKTLQQYENNVGEIGRIVTECIRHAASWWLTTLRKRIQVCVQVAFYTQIGNDY